MQEPQETGYMGYFNYFYYYYLITFHSFGNSLLSMNEALARHHLEDKEILWGMKKNKNLLSPCITRITFSRQECSQVMFLY